MKKKVLSVEKGAEIPQVRSVQYGVTSTIAHPAVYILIRVGFVMKIIYVHGLLQEYSRIICKTLVHRRE